MRKIIGLLIVVALLFSSCGKHFKHLTKETTKDKTTEVTKDKSVETIKDKSVSEKKMDVDTTFKVKGINLFGTLALPTDNDTFSLNNIISKQIIDENGTKLTLSYNKDKHEFTAKAEKPDTLFHAALHVDIKTANDITTTKDNNVVTSKDNDIVTNTKEKQKTHDFTAPKWTIIIIVAIVVIAVFIFLYLYLKPKKALVDNVADKISKL